MSLYLIVLLWLILCAVVEHIKGKTPRVLYVISFLVLAAMLCLRFGQGQDYFNYAGIYRWLADDFMEAINGPVHTEPGWKVLCFLFRKASISFPGFVFAVSVYIVVMFGRFLHKFVAERKLLALLICYHTLYLSYFMSMLRQAIVIATFLGLLLPWLLDRKYWRYLLVTAMLCSIHSVGLVLFLLPIVGMLCFKFKQLVCIAAMGFLLGTILSLCNIGQILKLVLNIDYLGETDISVIALAERIITFAVVTFCLYTYFGGVEPEPDDPMLTVYKVYALGAFLYGCLMWSALISSRTVYIFKTVEIVLICGTLAKCKRAKLLVLLYCILLTTVLYVKNIGSYLEQGQYRNATVLSYPYVSVFNQKDILNYRQDTVDYPFE